MAADKKEQKQKEQKQQVIDSKETKSIAPKEKFWALRDLHKAAEAGEMVLLKRLTKQWDQLQLSPYIQVTLLKAALKASNTDAFLFLLSLASIYDRQALELLESIALGSWNQGQKQIASKALMDKEFPREWDRRTPEERRRTSDKVKITLPSHLKALTEGEVNITGLDKNVLQQRDSSGHSIVHHASANGRLKTLQALQSSPLKLFTALTLYTEIQSSRILPPIYDDVSILPTDQTADYIKGGSFPWGPLFLAIENRHIDVMNWWLGQRESKAIRKYDFQPYSPCTHNAFLWAIQKGYLETAKWLVAIWEQNGMRPEQRNHLLGTALLIAINQAHLRIVKWLVDDKQIGLNINTVFVQHNRFSGDPTQKKLEELSPIPGDSFGWGKHKRPDGDYHRNFLFLSALSVQLCKEEPQDSNQLDIAECFIYACNKGVDAGYFVEQAIIHAASQGKTEVVKLLIPRGKLGADLLVNTIKTAIVGNNLDTLKLLLNVFSTLKNEMEESALQVPLHILALIEAAINNRANIVAWLVSNYGLNPADIPRVAELSVWQQISPAKCTVRSTEILKHLAQETGNLLNEQATDEDRNMVNAQVAELERLNNVYLPSHIASIKENLKEAGFTTAALQTIITGYTCVPTIAEALAPLYTDSNQTKASASTSSNNSENKEANAKPSTAQIELAHKAAADIAEHLNAIDGEIQLVGIDDPLWEAEISPTGQASAVITFNKEISKATITTLQEKYREYKFSTSSSTTTSSTSYSLHATRKTQQELAALTRSGSFSYSERGGSQSFPPPSPKAQGDVAGEKRETKSKQKGLPQQRIAVLGTAHPLGEIPAQIQQRPVVGVKSRAEENTQSVTRR